MEILRLQSSASLRPQGKTVKRETSEEMAGDRKRSLRLLLERKKTIINLIHLCSGQYLELNPYRTNVENRVSS